MPDVKIYYNPTALEKSNELMAFIRNLVASQMNCVDQNRQPIVHSPSQIDISVFMPITGVSTRYMLVEVEAYSWPDRMTDITARITNIADGLREKLNLPPDSVSVTFRPLPRDCWVSS